MLRKLSCSRARSSSISLLAVSVIVLSLSPSTAKAGQLGEQSYFDHSPHLIRSATSNDAAHNPATYEFTIALPADAGAPLQTVKIVQEQNLDHVHFDVARSSAFLGDSFAGGQSVPLAAIGGEMPKNDSEATVTFNPPIQPGQTVTVALDATANPWQGGVYLFGVTAYPEGNQASGTFLGFGRIHFQTY